jgi:hypothetical protein
MHTCRDTNNSLTIYLAQAFQNKTKQKNKKTKKNKKQKKRSLAICFAQAFQIIVLPFILCEHF